MALPESAPPVSKPVPTDMVLNWKTLFLISESPLQPQKLVLLLLHNRFWNAWHCHPKAIDSPGRKNAGSEPEVEVAVAVSTLRL